MNNKTIRMLAATAVVVSAQFHASRSEAAEGAMGRPISGAAINPYAGLVPPAPGFIASVGEEYYEGSIGGSALAPIGGNLTLNLQLKASLTPITLAYIWPVSSPHWNFASAASVPFAWAEATAQVTVGPRTGQIKQSTTGLWDSAYVPIQASYHFNETTHLSLSGTVWAPTGQYETGRIVQLSLNNWTFIPTLGFTKVFAGPNIELSATYAVEFYTDDPATGYHDGDISDLELLAVKRFKNGFGFGAIGSWIDQITDDTGATADLLQGFSGHVLGVGPILTYSKVIGKHDLELNARWIHEFDAKKRIEGDLGAISASFKF